MTPLATAAPPALASDLWPTMLFSSTGGQRPAGAALSVRAAYQLVLHGRAVLLDARSSREREVEGWLHPSLGAQVTDPAASVTAAEPVGQEEPTVDDAGRHRGARMILVLGGDPGATSRLVEALRRTTHRPVLLVAGGFAAWQDWGLPRVHPAAAAAA